MKKYEHKLFIENDLVKVSKLIAEYETNGWEVAALSQDNLDKWVLVIKRENHRNQNSNYKYDYTLKEQFA